MRLVIDGPDWAHGCPSCAFGIVRAPNPGILSLYLERAILAHHGRVEFCSCRAGHMARQYARRCWEDIVSDRYKLKPEAIDLVLAAAAETPTVHGPEPIARERVTA